MQISDEQFRGRTVIAADGQAIGEVAALFIDTSTWIIASLQIKLSKTAADQLVRLVQSVGDTDRGYCPPIRSHAGTAADSFGSRPASGKVLNC